MSEEIIHAFAKIGHLKVISRTSSFYFRGPSGFCQGKFEEAFAILNHLFEHQSSILLLGFSDPLSERITTSPLYRKYHQKIYAQKSGDSPPKKSKSSPPDQELVQKQLTTLTEFVDTEKPFLNPALTLRLLAGHIDIHPNQLSWLINEQVGKNFNEFINQKRIAHFKFSTVHFSKKMVIAASPFHTLT